MDQFGYFEGQNKIAVLADPQMGINASDSYTPSSAIKLVDASNDQPVMDLSATSIRGGATDALSGDILWQVDFTAFNTPGTYYILDETHSNRSYDFAIGEANGYVNLLKASLKQLYFQRCGQSKESDEWTDSACHLHTHQDSDCRDYHGILPNRDLSGGWHDAGDYGKYVGFAYPAVHDLLSSYLMNPTFWDSIDDVGIPESGNGRSDILDEVKWGLDWLLKMQVSGTGDSSKDSGILHIVGMMTDADNYWSKHVGKPASEDTSVRYFLGVSGEATCAGMSMLAYGAYTFDQAGLSGDSNAYLAAAEAAWTWAENNPDELTSNFEAYPANQIQSYFYRKQLIYGDVHLARFEAACFLHLLTGNSKYLDYITNNSNAQLMYPNVLPGGNKVNLGSALLNYALDPEADANVGNTIKADYVNFWGKPGNWHFKEDGANLSDGHNYPLWSAYWGANVFLCQQTAFGWNATKVDQNDMAWRKKLISASSSYLHGCNPLSLAYLTNVGASEFGGDRYLDVFYHGDENMENTPPPACIPGGPNGGFTGTSPLLPPNSPALKRFDPSKQAAPEYQYFEGQIKMQSAYIYMMTSIMDAFGPDVASQPATTNHSVPHTWLAEHDNSWSADYEAAAMTDHDGDGFTTWQEYWSGTDPTDAGSFLHFSDLQVDSMSARLIWSHASVDSSLPPIWIQHRTSLTTEAWQTIGWHTPKNGINVFELQNQWAGYYRLYVANVP